MKHVEWGLLIVNYLFLGGLSAGLFFLSALTTLLQKQGSERYVCISRAGAMIAPWPVMIGTFLLIFDLGRWYAFYKLMLHFRITSPMSIGTWLLLCFNLVSLLYLWSWMENQERVRVLSKLPKFAQTFNIDLSSWRKRLAVIGMPLSVCVGIYTGVLLGAVQSRPFWNTNLVAQLFLFSALSTGCAALMLALMLSSKAAADDMLFLFIADIFFLLLEFFIVVPYVIHGQLSVQPVQDALHLIMGGPYTLLFWGLFFNAGLLLPLIAELYEVLPSIGGNRAFHLNGYTVTATAILVLAGGFLLRYIFVYAGQVSAFN
jgi:formate-dependent nitrite reductase membrane component NrfD